MLNACPYVIRCTYFLLMFLCCQIWYIKLFPFRLSKIWRRNGNGTGVDRDKRWQLGDSSMIETNEYEYIGIYVSRFLKQYYYITAYIKDSIENKFNYKKRILGEHGNFNRVEFDNALWGSVLRPIIAHGYGTWISFWHFLPSKTRGFE